MQYELNKGITDQLKGIGIIFVIFGHLCLLDIIKMPSDKFDYAGVWGVTIFLILSGYGLTQSYLKKGIHFNFLSKRFSKVAIPYVIITIVWIVVDKIVFNIEYGSIQTLKVLLGLNFNYPVDPTMWYITYIFMWYIVFFVIFILPIKDILKVLLIISISLILHITSFNVIFDWNFYVFAFPIGVVISYGLSIMNKYDIKLKYQNMILILLTIIFFRLFLHYIFKVYDLTFYSLLSVSSIFLTFGLCTLLVVTKFKSKLLAFIGTISYELYLIEGKLLFIYGMPKVSDILWIRILDYTITILISAYVLSKISSHINKLNSRKWLRSLR
ncbi:acyltransferase family protein [Lysinibacillus fusiformis]|uniref:acyltransferase family protein n=1 Tax=Lysinibacillus fusiformis TaxID=28031 RepID=UPI002E1C3A77|nr:acyltransferase family protein [Lysinibacillus fusiformis]MED4888553.1 acyltransferase family protein [Lysinibacillus fusiformis]